MNVKLFDWPKAFDQAGAIWFRFDRPGLLRGGAISIFGDGRCRFTKWEEAGGQSRATSSAFSLPVDQKFAQ
jgi:hypothetical protein